MAAEKLFVLEGGSEKVKDSGTLNLSLLSVLIGTTGLAITETSGELDFNGVNLTNSGTIDGRNVANDGAALDSILDGGASKFDADQIDFEDIAASGKNIAAGAVETVLTALDDVIGSLPSPTNYVGGAAIADHLGGVDTVLGEKLDKAGDTMSGVLNMDGNAVENLPTPVNANDAVRKAYVDAVALGNRTKGNVAAASTGNVDVSSAPAAIDGYTLVTADRVLLKDQTTQTENGIYVFNGVGSAMTRAADQDNAPLAEIVNGVLIPKVLNGTMNAGKPYVIVSVGTGTDGLHTVGTDDIIWDEFTTPSTLTGGDGTVLNGQAIDVVVNDLLGDGIANDGANNFTVQLDGTSLSKSATGLKVADLGVDTNQLVDDSVTAAKLGAVSGEGVRQTMAGEIERDDTVSLTNDNAGAVTERQVVFIKSNGNVDLAQANVPALSNTKLALVSDASIATTAVGAFTFRSGARIVGFAGLTPGATYYLSDSVAGGINSVAPSASGTIIYKVGTAIDATTLEFMPEFVAEIV